MNCFLCGDKCESKKNFRKDWRLAATMEIRQTIEMRCEVHMRENMEDQWALEVLGRVKDCSDFVAAEGHYHVNCYARFCSQRDLKKTENTQAGRNPNREMMENFQRACDWLEPEIVLHSVKEIQDKMKEQVNGQAVYGVQYIKRLLTNRYQDHIYFCNEPGRENIVYLKEMADINEKYREKKTTGQEESKRIQTLAANLIKAEIREREFNKETYPSAGDIANLNWSPPLLRRFLKGLINLELEQESLAQCIVKAVKKDTIPPWLFGLGVDLNQTFGPKWLLRHL